MKTVLVTGASSGIGKTTVLLFAAHGRNVVAATRNPDQQNEFNDQVGYRRLEREHVF